MFIIGEAKGDSLRQYYKSDKKRREETKRRKSEEKRAKRLNKNSKNTQQTGAGEASNPEAQDLKITEE
jgi:hypothetical protein